MIQIFAPNYREKSKRDKIACNIYMGKENQGKSRVRDGVRQLPNSFCNFLVSLVLGICPLREYKIQLRVKSGCWFLIFFAVKNIDVFWSLILRGEIFKKFSRVGDIKGSRSSASIASKSILEILTIKRLNDPL